MDQFLQSALGSGRHDSEGNFTVSLDRSAWKLAQYRLANAGEYPLHVLACAVASGARRFELKCDFDSTHITFNGRPFDEDDFRMLANSLTQKNMPRRLRSLEVALSAAASQGTVRFGVRSPGFSKELRIIAGEAVLCDLPEQTSRETSFTVDACLSESNLRDLQRLGRYAPLTLRVSGQIVKPRRDDNFRPRGVLLIRGAERIQSFKCKPSGTLFVERLSSDGVSACLFLLEPGSGVEETLLYLSDGVIAQVQPSFPGFPMVKGFVTCDHLKKDISQTGLRRDKAFEVFEAWLDRTLDTFLSAFCASPPSLTRTFVREFHLQLKLRYKSRDMPKEVALFMEKTVDIQVSKEPNELKKLGHQASLSGSLITVERMQAQQLGELVAAWFAGDWPAALSWVKAQRVLLNAVDKPTEDLDALVCFLDFICSWEVDSRAQEMWTSDSTPPPQRYRALLLLLTKLDPQEVSSYLAELEIGESWKRPLEALVCREPCPRPNDVWTLIRCVWDGEFDQALALVNETDKESEIRAEIGPWLELLCRMAPGRCSWYTQVKLRARCSIAWLGCSDAKEFSQRLKDALVDLPPGPENSYWIWNRQTSTMACVLAAQLHHHESPTEQKRILARTLLLNSLDSSTGFAADADLPEHVFRG